MKQLKTYTDSVNDFNQIMESFRSFMKKKHSIAQIFRARF